MELLLRLTVFLTVLATAVAWKAAAPEPEPEPLITPGFAAVIILAVCKPIASQRATTLARRATLAAIRAARRLLALVPVQHTLLTKSMMTMIWRGPGSKADRVRRAPQRPPRFACAGVPRALCPS